METEDTEKERQGNVFRLFLNAIKPNTVVLGYALFFAANAASIWGGVFPFLPLKFQTQDLLVFFYLAQSLAFFITFSVCARVAYVSSKLDHQTKIFLAVGAYFLGWACLVAAIYLHDYVYVFVVAGGILLGVGAAAFYLLWEKVFASQSAELGTYNLILGIAYSAPVYLALHLVPRAIAAFLIPLVLLPLFALSLTLASREIDYHQPMFEDVPAEHVRVYRRAVTSMIRSAMCLGALAFCTGIVRAISIDIPAVGSAVNVLSMVAMLVAALSVMFLWRFKGLKLNLVKLYRIVFPIVITASLLLPLFPVGYAHWLAAALYSLYCVGLLLMMIQCAQVSRERGVHPTFAFGLFGGIVFGLNDIGFIAGNAISIAPLPGLDAHAATALLTVYVLALMFFASAVDFRKRSDVLLHGDTIDLVPLEQPASDTATNATAATAVSDATSDSVQKENESPSRSLEDELHQQIELISQRLRLSYREAEVAAYISRGYTFAHISELLFISENTMRTHTRRIYSKLGIHKKQELIDALEKL